jgi:FAD:protein FMN transferase
MNTPEPTGRRPGRRDFLGLCMGAFVVAAVPFATRGRDRMIRRTVPAMGSFAEIAVVHRDEHYAHSAIDAALAEIARVERLMTRFRADSDVGRINHAGPGTAITISGDTRDVLLHALRWADASDGAFDPCLARAVELWDVRARTAPPPPDAVRRLAGRSLYRALDIDGHRAIIGDPDVAIDLGGIAKGYGVDRAVLALREWGVTSGLVNLGGDLYALGSAADGEAWSVGVRAGRAPARLSTTLHVRDAAIATSGDYEQFFDHNGRRYHHLLDGRTGEPRIAAGHSLTIQADCCMTADAAATAVFGMTATAAQSTLRAAAPDALIVHAS